MRFSGCVLACVLCFAGELSAVDIHVDNVRGDDLRDGGTGRGVGLEPGPLRTIRRALEMAHAGDRIVLAKNDEPYRESLTLQGPRHGGALRVPLVIDGHGAILDGTLPVPATAWRFARRDVFQCEPVHRSTGLLYKDGMPISRPASRSRSALEPGQGLLDEGVVWYRLEAGVLPSTLDMRWTAHTVGITLYEVHDVEIRDLIVQGFALDGINLHDGATNVELTRLSLRGNGRSGLHVGGASRAILRESHASENGRSQIHLEGAARLQLSQCEIWEDSAPSILQDGGTIAGDVPAKLQ